MILSDQKINYLNTVTHDGKVVFFGTAPDGTLWYSIKRSGFEDSALADATNPFGFEKWKALTLDASSDDPSVRADEKKKLTDTDGKPLLRSVYGAGAEVTRSAPAQVQLVSALGHVYLFRQSATTGKILVNRFVLDGMKNELIPKLDVRFRRSRQRLAAEAPTGKDMNALAQSDALDYRDMDGNPFYEPATELSFIPATQNGWFTAAFAATADSQRSVWHVVAYDPATSKVLLYSVTASALGLFRIKDEILPASGARGETYYRTVTGIVQRTLELQGFTVAGRPAAVTYDVQSERQTSHGAQLVRDAARVMLTVPVRKNATSPVTVAAISFAVAEDGALSKVDLTPDRFETLRSTTRPVMLPIDELDQIKVIGQAAPPPAGVIAGMHRGAKDRVQVRAKGQVGAVAPGNTMRISGTASYDGHYKVAAVDGASFVIEAAFTSNEPGFWEVVPEEQTGLVFDNMIVGYEQTADGKLRVACVSHDLAVGDEVQLVGADGYDGDHRVRVIDADTAGFTIDAKWKPGEAANLKKVHRRGLVFDGVNDMLEATPLELPLPATPNSAFGRTVSAWVKITAAQSKVQHLVGGEDEVLRLVIRADNKVALEARLSDGTIRTVVDPETAPVGKWVHYAGTVDYVPVFGGDTRLALCRNGVKVLPVARVDEAIDGKDKLVPRGAPPHLDDTLIAFDGVDDAVSAPGFGSTLADKSFSVELWARRQRSGAMEVLVHQGTDGANTSLSIGFLASDAFTFGFSGDDLSTTDLYPDTEWHHWACTYDRLTRIQRIYRDGAFVIERTASAHFKGNGDLYLGAKTDGTSRFQGRIADVRVWERVREEDEIRADLSHRLSGMEARLAGYWPLGGLSLIDHSTRKRHGVATGAPAWSLVVFRMPAVAVYGALDLGGAGDHATFPNVNLKSRSFTLSFWARRMRTSLQETMLSQGTSAASCGLSIAFLATGELRFSFSGDDADSTVAPPAQAWHHFACVYDAATRSQQIYCDGAPVGQHTASAHYQGSGDLVAGRLAAGFGASALDAFQGQMAELHVWDSALSATDVQTDMYRYLAGTEDGLLGYWPMDDGMPHDYTSRKAHGRLHGAPRPYLLHHSIAGRRLTAATACFAGEMADVRIWGRALGEREIKDGMNLLLTGKEPDLVGYYRLGAVVAEDEDETGAIVPDFSAYGRHARVYGEPFGGARQLDRATSTGAKAVQYTNGQLVAVRQVAMYEESFEFKVTSSDSSFDPTNADGQGNNLFAFSYWGKRSEASDDVIVVPAGAVEEADYESLGDGWYRASCRVTIPEGLNVLRAMEITKVRGRWLTGDTPPASEWTAILVRKHGLRLISDAISRETYTDTIAPAALSAPGAVSISQLATLEARIRDLSGQISDLLERIDVAQNIDKYTKERAAAQAQIPSLTAQREQAKAEVARLRDHLGNYRMILRNCGTGRCLTTHDADALVYYWEAEAQYREQYRWEAEYIDGTWFSLKAMWNGRPIEGRRLSHVGDGQVKMVSASSSSSSQWRADRIPGDRYRITNRFTNRPMEVSNASITFANSGYQVTTGGMFATGFHQEWEACWKELTPAGAQRINAVEARARVLQNSIDDTEKRVSRLDALLSVLENVATLTGLLTTARTNLQSAWIAYNTANTAALTALATSVAQRMPRVASDDRDLVTEAGLLEFAEPMGGVSLIATCEGNVQLGYVDTQGRLRATLYDATSDSRSSTFEQWLSDGDRACLDFRDPGDKLLLAGPVAPSGDSWTLEAWFQYPGARHEDGTPYDFNAFAGGTAAGDSPLCIRGGNRMGVVVDGFFHDSGVNLDRTITPGWHHVAAVGRIDRTDFYVDGELECKAEQVRYALQCDGVDDCIDLPALGETFAQGITVEAWVYLDSPAQASTWRGIVTQQYIGPSPLVQFNLSVDGATHQLQAGFHDGAPWRITKDPDGLPLNRWVHVAATYDGHRVTLYRDGTQVAISADFNRALPAGAAGWRIARRHDFGDPASMWKGQIGEVHIWRSVHGNVQIREDMYKALTGTESDLVASWTMATFEDGAAIKARDLGPSTKHGTLLGGATVRPYVPQLRAPLAVIGNLADGSSPVGKLAEVRLWGTALGDDEIDAVSKLAVSGNEPGLLAYWPLREAAGETTYNRVDGSQATLVGVDWVVCTGNLGGLGTRVALFDGHATEVRCPGPSLAGRGFTVELWARRQRTNAFEVMVQQGTKATEMGLHLGFRANAMFTFAFTNDDLDTPEKYTDTDWHHWACTYDATTRARTIYRDGERVIGDTAKAHFQGSGEMVLGRNAQGTEPFQGHLAEVRVWDRVLTPGEIRAGMRLRARSTASGLLRYWPLSTLDNENKTQELSPAAAHGVVHGALVLKCVDLPVAGGADVVSTEYATIGVRADGRQQGMMRRCFGVTEGDAVRFVHEARVESLVLQWIGNAQFKPTLLGYIEGPPPVPSENLTLSDDYNGATSVKLSQSESVSYGWERSTSRGQLLTMDLFLGAAWDIAAGIGVETKATAGKIGGALQFDTNYKETWNSAISAASTLATSDGLSLRGCLEDKPAFDHLGKRFLPKNLGYALVISGLADIFILKLERSGRMVSYEVRPVEGIPIDINTITFLINPTYTLNGSLDGMVGSSAADERFYGHVPAMRAQYGALYPASYYRLKEAYDLAAEIETKDKDREAYFVNYDARNIRYLETPKDTTSNDDLAQGGDMAGDDSSDDAGSSDEDKENAEAQEKTKEQTAEQKKKGEEDAEKRKAAINDRIGSQDGRTRASSAFEGWQKQMERILVSAGKRNIVNKYVWDGDGGLRAESQSFASTVEHSFGSEFEMNCGGGFKTEFTAGGFAMEANLIISGTCSTSSTKKFTLEKSLELEVDLSGVESMGITGRDDTPLMPGEKVDRYRFMTFYLENETRHFDEFFRKVVDPEWLMSNDEEARALRQVQAGKPNRCWRVLHRVTYVERPALMGFGRDVRALAKVDEDGAATPTMAHYFEALSSKQAGLESQMEEILSTLRALAAKPSA